MKRVLSILLAISLVICALPMSVFVIADEEEYYTYEVLATDEAIITDVDWKIRGDITIPSSLGGYNVTGIGDSAFDFCDGITSVIIPDSVIAIGDNAFANCSGITSVTIPDSVVSIGDAAFYGCEGLTSVSIPKSVTSIGDRAFGKCNKIASIIVEDDNTVYHSKNNCLIQTTTKELVLGCKNSSIPYNGSVRSIGKYAFEGCTGFKSIIIPNVVTQIKEGAFQSCKYLEKIAVPISVTSIADNAFLGCKKLAEVWYPGNDESKDNISIALGNEALTDVSWNYFTPGLVTGASEISATDALKILYVIVGKETFTFGQKMAADVDGNGKISTVDALQVLYYIVEKITKFPISEPPVDVVVTFNTNGGSAVESQTIYRGETVTVPTAPEKEGFAFVGWYIDSKYSASFDFTKPINSSCTIFARWVDIVDTTDTDGDGLTDPYEEFYGTNASLIDTDGDGLSDYIEIVVINYNPLSKDTDNDGVLDGQEDFDDDGIDNKSEIDLGTDPSLKDTDGDGLDDSAEIDTYKTDPVLNDTDQDGVSDGKEIELGTDPLVAQASFNMILSANNGNEKVIPSVEIELAGEQVETLRIDEVNNDNFFPETMPGYMGKAYDFNVDGQFSDATISFEFDSDMLENGADPVICYFNEETQELEELATTIKGNVASATVTHFSKYILIDRKIYNDSFIWTDVWDSNKNYTSVEVVLVIDDSGSLGGDYGYNSSLGIFTGGKDPEHKRLEVARNFVDNANTNTKIGIVKFDGVIDNLTGELIECTSQGKNTLKNILKFTYKSSGAEYNISGIFDSRGKTYMYGGIEKAIEQFSNSSNSTMKTVIVFTDGDAHDASKHDSVITKALNNDVKIYTVGLGTSSSYFNSYLKPLATNTGGAFYLASDAGQLADIYKNISEKIDIETDSDADGIPDYYEDNMICFNGVKLALDKNNPDTDGDGLKDGEEVELKYEYNADRTQVKVTGKLVKGNPTIVDSDGDGILDQDDTAPLIVGLKNGIVGALTICSYGTGPSSSGNFDGHAFVAYTSFIKDSIGLYGILVDSYDNCAKKNDKRNDNFDKHVINVESNDVITLGGWAGWLPDNLKGCWINNELMIYDKTGTPSDQRSLTVYITEEDVDRMYDICKKNCKWTELYNCSAFAVDFWNEITGDNLSARGWLVFRNPASLSNNIEKEEGFKIGANIRAEWPQ